MKGLNTEENERIQSLLRNSMLLMGNNQGVMNLQKILPQLEAYQASINKILDKKNNNNILSNVINDMRVKVDVEYGPNWGDMKNL